MADRLSNVIRRKFVDYFTLKHNHKFVPSSSILPTVDKSLAFVNSGMYQFKNLIMEDRPSYDLPRVCNYQKCIRVGGKLCDLDQIGLDMRHHTFFEMLGNWSFNDYGKQEACEWALDFLVNQINLDINKIHVSYLAAQHEEDIETRDIWLRLGIPSERILKKGVDENFWQCGVTGPCGPSSEIFYPAGGKDGGELLEIWNLVFMDRTKIESDNPQVVPLKSKFVDTGMGLERVLSILEGSDSNYDTDLFRNHINSIHAKCPPGEIEPYSGSLTNQLDIDYRLLADHSRMITVALVDGLEPGRRGNEFHLRSIIKKSLDVSRETFLQEQPRLLLFDLMDETINSLGDAYPEMKAKTKEIRKMVAKQSKVYNLMQNRQLIADRGQDLMNIKQFLSIDPREPGVQEIDYCLGGRIASIRPYKRFHFVDLIDGSTRKHAQLVLDKKLLDKPQTGAYLTCKGKIVPSNGGMQASEFKVDKIIQLGDCDPDEYPLATVNETSWNALRRRIHLRPRNVHFGSLLRVRSELEMSLHMIMKQMDFFRVHTPSFTANDSEASSDLFTVRRTKLTSKERQTLEENLGLSDTNLSCTPMTSSCSSSSDEENEDDDDKNSDTEFSSHSDLASHSSSPGEPNEQQYQQQGLGEKVNMKSHNAAAADDDRDERSDNLWLGKERRQSAREARDDYFNKDIFLITSGQLHLECLAASLSRVYTLSNAFRAENSHTRRHLCEFLMFEAEESNVFELNSLMDRVETIIKFAGHYLTEVSEHREDFLDLQKLFKNEENFKQMMEKPFVRMEYQDALKLLREDKEFDGPTYFGCDLGRIHELTLLKIMDNRPIFVTRFPKRMKPFYMKTNHTNQLALCFDLIAPFGGEICGGSLREEDLDKLNRNMQSHNIRSPDGSISKNFNWYLETRQFGTFPHGGFGIGFERLIQSFLGMKNIRDTTPFPRWSGRCPM